MIGKVLWGIFFYVVREFKLFVKYGNDIFNKVYIYVFYKCDIKMED